MKNSQRGFISFPLLVVILLVVIGGGTYVYKNKKVQMTPLVNNEVGQVDRVNEQAISDVGVKPAARSSITLLSPNGGEKWDIKSTQGIKWSITPVNTAKVDLYLDKENSATGAKTAYTIGKSVSIDRNVDYREAYNWVVGTDLNNSNITVGQYTVRACLAGSTTNCDSSNTKFSIADLAFDNDRAPTISDVFGPTELAVGQSGTWTVAARDLDNDEIKYTLPQVISGGKVLSSGYGYSLLFSKNDTFTLSFPKAGIYSINFQVVDKYGKSYLRIVTVRVQ